MPQHQILIDIGQTLERKAGGVCNMVAGISYAEFSLLSALAQTSGLALTRVQLAEQVGLTPSGVSRALKPLEKIGMIESVKAERDARQSLARLSPAGQEAQANAQAALDDLWAGLPHVSLDEESLEDFLLALKTPKPRHSLYKERAAFINEASKSQ